LKPGQDFGIISYNDTPLKEVLAGGITTLSTDFRLMGKTMAKLIDTKAIMTIKNPWQLNIRGSL
jgi:DNA-binding LacI/PurR family transcriptional regulator